MCDILEGIPEDVAPYTEQLYKSMKDNEKAGIELIRSRLDICAGCDNKLVSTCLKCGCYVQMRVLSRQSKCPVKKW